MADLTHKRSKKSRAKKSRAILISVYRKVMDYGKCLDCGECNTSYNWCQTCNSKHFIICFTKWSSGNRDIDKFIRNIQINASSRNRVLEWIPYDRLTGFKMIGKGGFGNVQKATWTEGQIDLRIGWNYLRQRWERHGATQVAVKILDNSRNITAEFFKEMMPSLRTRPAIPSHVKNHLNRILGISKNPTTQKYVIIMQFANNGNLRNYLKKNYSTITWDRKLLILQYIAGGLKSLHALGLIHKNLHSNNILLHEEIPFIGDLGLCRPVDKFDEKEEIYGVLPYVSPEVLRTKVYTKESDIYSFAFIMWEMCTYLPPLYDRSHDTNLALEIFHGLRPNILEGTPRTFARFMKLCWDANPSKRPTAEEVYNTLKYWHMEFSQKRPTECYSDFKAADDWKKKKLLNNPNIPYTNHHPNAHYMSRPLQLPEVINDFTSNQNTHLENFARGEKSIYRQLMPIQLIIYDIDIY